MATPKSFGSNRKRNSHEARNILGIAMRVGIRRESAALDLLLDSLFIPRLFEIISGGMASSSSSFSRSAW